MRRKATGDAPEQHAFTTYSKSFLRLKNSDYTAEEKKERFRDLVFLQTPALLLALLGSREHDKYLEVVEQADSSVEEDAVRVAQVALKYLYGKCQKKSLTAIREAKQKLAEARQTLAAARQTLAAAKVKAALPSEPTDE